MCAFMARPTSRRWSCSPRKKLQAFSCEYIANLLESRKRLRPEPAALQLTRRQDLLELEMPEPDLTLYESTTAQEKETP